MEVELIDSLAGSRAGLTQLQRRWRPVDDAGVPVPPRAAVLLVHGLGEHSARHAYLGAFLAERGLDVLGFDNRGHGQSGGPRGHVGSFVEFVDDVEDLVVERHQLDRPVILLGHSLGGLIAATAVVEGRARPDLLVLSSPALGASGSRWQRLAAPLLGRVVPRVRVPSGTDGTRVSRDPAAQAAYADDPLRLRGVSAGLGREIFGAMTSTSAQLDRITVPSYVLHGSDDEVVAPEASRPLNALPNVTYRLWPGLRHECFNEPERAEVAAALMAWIDDQLDLLPGERPRGGGLGSVG
ncbi:MAG: lysophospholipase [Acidimicrobiales bacterium]